MAERGLSFDDAYQQIKLSRPCIDPNPGFQRQLKMWSAMKFNIEGNTIIHRRWRVMKLAREWSYSGKVTSPLPTLVYDTEVHCCCSCQEPLFAPANIISHDRDMIRFGGITATDADCDLHVVEPMSWMAGSVVAARYGAIECPKCKAEIGLFCWHGEQCSCGTSIYPSFQIQKEKIVLKK